MKMKLVCTIILALTISGCIDKSTNQNKNLNDISKISDCPDTGKISIEFREKMTKYYNGNIHNVYFPLNDHTNYASLTRSLAILFDTCKCISNVTIHISTSIQYRDSVKQVLEVFSNAKSLKTLHIENLNNISQLKSYQNIDSLFIEIFDSDDPYGNLNTDINTLLDNSDSLRFLYYERSSGILSPYRKTVKLVNDSMRLRRKDILFTPTSTKKSRLEFVEIVWGSDTENYYYKNGKYLRTEKLNFK